MPKSKKVWIFGAGNGTEYNDNSKALFEYVNINNENRIRAIWLTRNINVRNTLKKNNFEVYLFYSLKGIYFSLIAKVLIISTSFLDLNLIAYLFSKKNKIIQLWHGTPLKKLESHKACFLKEALLGIFLKYIGRDCDLVFTATKENIDIYKKQFRVSEKQIRATGQPRNDILFKQNDCDKSNKKIILFLPTWREYKTDFSFFSDKVLGSSRKKYTS